jgi:hypothetical protein
MARSIACQPALISLLRPRLALQNRIFERDAFRVELLEPVVCDTAVNEDFQVLGTAVACEHWGCSHDKTKGTSVGRSGKLYFDLEGPLCDVVLMAEMAEAAVMEGRPWAALSVRQLADAARDLREMYHGRKPKGRFLE